MKRLAIHVPLTDEATERLAALYRAKPHTVFVVEGGATARTVLEGDDEDVNATEKIARAMGFEVLS